MLLSCCEVALLWLLPIHLSPLACSLATIGRSCHSSVTYFIDLYANDTVARHALHRLKQEKLKAIQKAADHLITKELINPKMVG